MGEVYRTMKKKKILITGVTGFLGEEMALHLKDNYEVYGLARMSVKTRSQIEELEKHIKIVYGDIQSASICNDIVQTISPHIIMHYAAASQVQYSFTHPEEVLKTNFLATAYLAEAARKVKNFEKFIFASTIETYGDQKDKTPYKEKAETYPNCPYAVAKVACEKYLLYLHRTFDFPAIMVRQSNVYGRTKDAYFIVEKIITSMLKNKKVIYLGSPYPVRSFIYKNDLLSFEKTIIDSTDKKLFGQIFNTGPANGVTIENLAIKIAGLLKWNGKIVWNKTEVRPGKGEVWYLNVSNAKFKKFTGWKESYTLTSGLKKTINYWKEMN
jgi:UDP-glucose 4-epimerase